VIVVDASVVVAGLASGGATGGWAESVLAGEPLAAPHVLPVEAASILRRAERAGEISTDAASLAYADLGRLRVEYFPYAPFAERIWELCAALPGSHPQQGLLQRLRLGIADAQTSRKRIELQIGALESSGELERRAGEATAAGRADLAREALDRMAGIQAELSGLRAQYQSLQVAQDKLIAASQELQRVELQMNQLQKESDRLDNQARQALSQGREDLALAALQSKASLQAQLNDLQAQFAQLQDQEAKIDAVRLAKTEATWPGAAPQAGPATLSCYDAWYVALAEFLGVKLATLNARLARAPGPRCGFWLPPAESAPGP
jgi:predicted nucleic acid-binding protein